MASSLVQIRLDDDLKSEASALDEINAEIDAARAEQKSAGNTVK